MKQTILAILLSALVFMPVVGTSDPLPLASVAPMAQIYYDSEGTATFSNVCTVTGINEKEHYWLTAYHCISDAAPDVKHYVKGEAVGYVMKDPTNDLAVLSTPVSTVPAVKIATVAPSLGDRVTVIGHPLGQVYPIVTVGQIAGLKAVFPSVEGAFTFLQVPGAPASSGSAVLNERNEIISVVQRGTSPNNWGPVMAGVLFEKLDVVRMWVEKPIP